MQALTSPKIGFALFGERAALQVAACGLCSPATGGTGAAASCGVARAASRAARERQTVPLGTAKWARSRRLGCFSAGLLALAARCEPQTHPPHFPAPSSRTLTRDRRGHRWSTHHPTPPTHHICAFVLGPSIYPHFPRSHRPVGGGSRLSSLTHPIPSPVLTSPKGLSSHARETPTSLPLPPASRVVSRRVFVVAASRAPTPPTCF